MSEAVRPRKRAASVERVDKMLALAKKHGLTVTGIAADGTVLIDSPATGASPADAWLAKLEDEGRRQ